MHSTHRSFIHHALFLTTNAFIHIAVSHNSHKLLQKVLRENFKRRGSLNFMHSYISFEEDNLFTEKEHKEENFLDNDIIPLRITAIPVEEVKRSQKIDWPAEINLT